MVFQNVYNMLLYVDWFLGHVIIGTNNYSSLIIKVYLADNFYFYGLLKHYCPIILRILASLNWVNTNFKDSRERHIRKTCTSEYQIGATFSWYFKKHSYQFWGKLCQRRPSPTSKKLASENIYENIQFTKVHENRSPGMLPKIGASRMLLIEISFRYTLCGRRGQRTLWRIKWRRQGNQASLGFV